MWTSELHCANEVSISVFWKGEDTKWHVSAPSVWSFPADADGDTRETGRSSCSEKAVESGDGETQDLG